MCQRFLTQNTDQCVLSLAFFAGLLSLLFKMISLLWVCRVLVGLWKKVHIPSRVKLTPFAWHSTCSTNKQHTSLSTSQLINQSLGASSASSPSEAIRDSECSQPHCLHPQQHRSTALAEAACVTQLCLQMWQPLLGRKPRGLVPK